MVKKFKLIITLFFLFLGLTRINSLNFAQSLEKNLIKDFYWRNIGPANTNGRISDIETLDRDFTFVLVASASGGVWKSTNAGTTWEPIFDHYGSSSIGDVAIFQKNPDIIWIGTGERNCRNSVGWGDGIYKSTNSGKTFTNMGLEDTKCISRIIINPNDPNIVYAAAAGDTWGYSGERGLFKTEDGGKTWRKLTNGLPHDGKTGAIDLVMYPQNPNILYVAFWQRLRLPYRFESGGPNGGIFMTKDGGQSWQKLINGLPKGDTGKIGLAISRSNPKVLMAIIEHGYHPQRYLKNGRPNPDYDDMSKLGSGIYRSENEGNTWHYMNRRNILPFYYSHIYINPLDDKTVYVLDTDLNVSYDGGKTFSKIGINAYQRGNTPFGLHGDYHAMWLDPTNKNRFYIGDDGGVALTHDHKHFIFFDNFVISQFYDVCVDMRDPYYVYGGLQDHANWGGPSRSRDRGILTDHWFRIFGGDGFYVQVDPTDWRTLYFESQNGEVSRMNVETRQAVSIRPRKNNIINYSQYVTKEILKEQKKKGWGTEPFRFNWNTPILIFPHNPRIIFIGGNHLFKSVDRGDHWQIISPDLSKNDPVKTRRESGGLTPDITGAEYYGTITTISESPLAPGLIWAGTDDGNVQLTQDNGYSWINLRSNVPLAPRDLWVSRIEASHFKKGTAYLTFDGHRSDNFKPWVFKTNDYGESWINISRNLPDDYPVYVIREDLKNPNFLFVGTEFGVFYSINGGQSWSKQNNNLPTVAIHDLVIHPRDGDLIAGTHGRGIWILDDITPLQQLTDKILKSKAYLFNNRIATQWLRIRRGGDRGHFYFEAPNPPDGAIINYYLQSVSPKEVTIKISDVTEALSRVFHVKAEPGIHRIYWDMHFEPNPKQCKEFVTSLQKFIERQERKVNLSERKQLEEQMIHLKEAGTNVEEIKEIENRVRKIGGRFTPHLRGPEAKPGIYKITMSVDDQVYTGKIIVRNDPLLSEEK